MRINDKIKKEAVKLSKFFGTVAIAGSITAGLIYSSCHSNKNRLTEEDFKRKDWYIVYSSNPSLINYFENEDIYPSAENFRLYQEILKKENKGQVIGWIKVPDMNNDGKVDINRAFSKKKISKHGANAKK